MLNSTQAQVSHKPASIDLTEETLVNFLLEQSDTTLEKAREACIELYWETQKDKNASPVLTTFKARWLRFLGQDKTIKTQHQKILTRAREIQDNWQEKEQSKIVFTSLIELLEIPNLLEILDNPEKVIKYFILYSPLYSAKDVSMALMALAAQPSNNKFEKDDWVEYLKPDYKVVVGTAGKDLSKNIKRLQELQQNNAIKENKNSQLIISALIQGLKEWPQELLKERQQERQSPTQKAVYFISDNIEFFKVQYNANDNSKFSSLENAMVGDCSKDNNEIITIRTAFKKCVCEQNNVSFGQDMIVFIDAFNFSGEDFFAAVSEQSFKSTVADFYNMDTTNQESKQKRNNQKDHLMQSLYLRRYSTYYQIWKQEKSKTLSTRFGTDKISKAVQKLDLTIAAVTGNKQDVTVNAIKNVLIEIYNETGKWLYSHYCSQASKGPVQKLRAFAERSIYYANQLLEPLKQCSDKLEGSTSDDSDNATDKDSHEKGSLLRGVLVDIKTLLFPGSGFDLDDILTPTTNSTGIKAMQKKLKDFDIASAEEETLMTRFIELRQIACERISEPLSDWFSLFKFSVCGHCVKPGREEWVDQFYQKLAKTNLALKRDEALQKKKGDITLGDLKTTISSITTERDNLNSIVDFNCS